MNSPTISTSLSTPPSTSVLELRSELSRSILLVGDRDALLQALPSLKEELANCQQLHSCGELPGDDPATELWQRINAVQPERIWIVGGDGLSTWSVNVHCELIRRCRVG